MCGGNPGFIKEGLGLNRKRKTKRTTNAEK